jgi:uncharacterized protein (DUF952 family)
MTSSEYPVEKDQVLSANPVFDLRPVVQNQRVDLGRLVIGLGVRRLDGGTGEGSATRKPRIATGMTWHLCALDHWIGQSRSNTYTPERFEEEEFVHCTNKPSRLMEIADLFYRNDPRKYVVLEIDLDSVPVPAVYEDEANEFPHIYGRVPVLSVRRVLHVERGEDGAFRCLRDLTGQS